MFPLSHFVRKQLLLSVSPKVFPVQFCSVHEEWKPAEIIFSLWAQQAAAKLCTFIWRLREPTEMSVFTEINTLSGPNLPRPRVGVKMFHWIELSSDHVNKGVNLYPAVVLGAHFSENGNFVTRLVCRCRLLWNQNWSEGRTRDPNIVGSIPVTDHLDCDLGEVTSLASSFEDET
jgi:hypothetical protein